MRNFNCSAALRLFVLGSAWLLGAVEVARADGVELVGELIGAGPGLDDCEGSAGVADDVGVGREVEAGVQGAGARLLSQGSGHVARAHPPVAIPLGLAVTQPS